MASLTPTMNQATTYAPSGYNAATTNQDVSPQATIQQILTAFQPQAAQSNMNLQNSLAASGITGGANADATTNLQGTLASSLGSTLAQAIENSQSLGLNQAQTNAGALNSAGQYNAGAQNSANQYDAGATNQTNEFNTANNMTMEQFLANLQNSDYLAQLGSFTGLNEAGLGAQQGLNSQYSQSYQVPSTGSNPFGGLGAALGAATNTGSTPSTPSVPTPAPDGSLYA
jgi:hypothetical protein